MTARKRFAVSILLLVAVCVVLAVGYARWNHYVLVREAKLLEPEGVKLDWDETWLNWIRPVSVNEAWFEYSELPNGNWRIGDADYELDEVMPHYDAVAVRLQRLGLEEVRIVKNGERTDEYLGTKKGL